MAILLEQFVKQLEDSGILATETIKDFLPPKTAVEDPKDLARELVRKKKLTKYQVEEVWKGKGKSLVVGNYVLLEKIGAGGMGQVFKAEHRRMHRTVAVKMLPLEFVKNAGAIARFEREVMAAAKLRHPNIVAADDADCANGVHFLVMEYVEGRDLSELVKQGGPLPADRAVDYILQAARGVAFAHQKGVVHRDIKPANLLLDSEGTVKVLDMGLARIHEMGDTATLSELTSTGMIMGTVDYMPPEQAVDSKKADHRADIYSLGCTLFYLLTARSVYQGDTIMAKLLAHRETPVPSLRIHQAEIPARLEPIFAKMVAKKVEDRYQTMTEVIADLESCRIKSSPEPQPTLSARADGLTQFLNEVSLASVQAEPHIKSKRAHPKTTGGNRKKRTTPFLIGGGVFGVLALLAGIVISLKSKDGNAELLLTVNEPGANVTVLKEQDAVEISGLASMKGTMKILLVPGKKKLLVKKDGFELYTEEFSIESGGHPELTAKLVRVTKPEPVEVVANGKSWESPAFQQWMKDVAAMPAEKQVEAVSKKLMELNPGFDGKLWNPYPGEESRPPAVQDGNILELLIYTDNVADLSPIRALSELKGLKCITRQKTGRRLDLSPLNGMKIRALVCVVDNLDLSTVKGLPLTELVCIGGGITNLTPVSGMPLQKMMLSGNWELTNLAPLKGLPLKSLAFDNTQVADLSPLSGMSLTFLGFQVSKVADLSPLKGMPLEELYCDHTLITDLSPLAGMKLKKLSFPPNPELKGLQAIRQMNSLVEIGTAYDKMIPSNQFWKQYDEGAFGLPRGIKPVTDIKSPEFQKWMNEVQTLRAEDKLEAVRKKLKELNPRFDGKLTDGESKPPFIENGVVVRLGFATDNVTDVSPVRALTGLYRLSCVGSGPEKGQLSDLSPLKGMPLANLDLSNTKVTDLSPLRGMPLWWLICDGTPVADLSSLQGMPLTNLGIGRTKISDLSALKGMSLMFFSCDSTLVSDLSPLRGMQLNFVHIRQTKVTDLSPLIGSRMSLKRLVIVETPVSDVSPLEGMKLTEFVFTPKNITQGMDVVRKMKTIERFGTLDWGEFSPEEFWKKYDAGEFGKPR